MWILLLFLSLAPAFAEDAAPQCEILFSSMVKPPPVIDWVKVAVPNLNADPLKPDAPETIDRVTKLAERLVKENAAPLSTGEYAKIEGIAGFTKVELQYQSLQTGASKYATYSFSGTGIAKDGSRVPFNLNVRSNGNVAFLNSTWQYRINAVIDQKRFNLVYFDGSDVKAADQGEAILQSLPDLETISRNMSYKERDKWLNGQPYFPSVMFGNRVHFMPDQSRFNSAYEPYYVAMKREDLIQFYRRGEMEVNIYEDVPGFDLSKVPVNIEYVFLGDKSTTQLAPFMQTYLSNEPKK